MASTMKDFSVKGGEYMNEAREYSERAEEIRKDIEGLKKQLENMPGGIDPELLTMISEAEESARNEARSDAGSVESALKQTEGLMRELQERVREKIGENNEAKSRISGVESKYARESMSRILEGLDENSDFGRQLLQDTDRSVSDAQRVIQDVQRDI